MQYLNTNDSSLIKYCFLTLLVMWLFTLSTYLICFLQILLSLLFLCPVVLEVWHLAPGTWQCNSNAVLIVSLNGK